MKSWLFWLSVLYVSGMEIPLVSLRGEDGREYSTTDFERLQNPVLDTLHPRMPFRMPKTLQEQAVFFMLNDNIRTAQETPLHGNKFKGLKDSQYKQIEDLYQNSTVFIDNYDDTGHFDKDKVKEQDLLIRVQTSGRDDLAEQLSVYNQVFSANETVEALVTNGTKSVSSVYNPINSLVDQYVKEQRFLETEKDVHTNDKDIEMSSLGRTPYKSVAISKIWASSVFT